MFAEPDADGVNVEVQVAVAAVVPAAKEQVVKVPVAPVEERAGEPVGVIAVPAVDESVTVTVHVEP